MKNFNCHQHKNPISINNIDINKVVISNKQELKKYEYVFSNSEIQIYSEKENFDDSDDSDDSNKKHSDDSDNSD